MGLTPCGGRGGPLALALLLAGGLTAAASPSTDEIASSETPIPEALPPPEAPAALDPVWLAPTWELEERVTRTRRLASARGLANLDALARVLLIDPGSGSPLERARAAAQLAPGLPAAHAALASARWGEERDIPGALHAALAALVAMPHHLEASLWCGATGLTLLAWSLAGAGLGFIGLAAAVKASRAAHDLGDALHRAMPDFARAAVLGALLLVPAAAGEGVLGAGLMVFGLAFCYADRAGRLALAAAATVVTVGLHPVAEQAARFLTAPGSDPVAEAAYAAENGIPSALELARLEHGARSDPLALGALALRAKRAGALHEADSLYHSLLEAAPPAARAINNAANVRLELGDAEGAITLYRSAVAKADSALIWFNLSQAYARAIRVDEHDRALAEAQARDASTVRELTNRLATSPSPVLPDLLLSTATVRRRLLQASAGAAGAAALRHPLAPGRLGASPRATGGAFAAVALVAGVLASCFRRSAGCPRCGARLCPRCRGAAAIQGLCEGCARLLHRPETVDPSLRTERLGALRRRSERRAFLARIAAWVVPGAAGLGCGRPLLGLTALILFGAALASALGRHGIVSDPLALGLAGPLGFSVVALVLALAYLVLTAAGVWLAVRSTR